jgi:hypothetical protein
MFLLFYGYLTRMTGDYITVNSMFNVNIGHINNFHAQHIQSPMRLISLLFLLLTTCFNLKGHHQVLKFLVRKMSSVVYVVHLVGCVLSCCMLCCVSCSRMQYNTQQERTQHTNTYAHLGNLHI